MLGAKLPNAICCLFIDQFQQISKIPRALELYLIFRLLNCLEVLFLCPIGWLYGVACQQPAAGSAHPSLQSATFFPISGSRIHEETRDG